MSKKLIAVASAAALALTALVGVAPANASITIAVDGTNGADSGAGTSASPYLESVPVANLLDANTSIEFDVTTVVGDVMTVTATGSVRILKQVTGTDADKLFTSTSGLTTYTATATTTTTSFIAYNTSTTAGSFVVSKKSANGLSTATGDAVYVKGVVGTSYNFNVTAPATLAANTEGEVLITVTDMFGNALENNATASTLIETNDSVAGLGTVPTLGAATWDATRKVYVASLSAVTTAVEFAYILTVPSGSVADVGGLAKPKRGGFFQINSATVSAQVTTLTAQVAALTAQVTALTADYNALAKKWNKRFASKTAPKKKAVLK